MNDFSAAVMTSSANDDNSTKELKGFVKQFQLTLLYNVQPLISPFKFWTY